RCMATANSSGFSLLSRSTSDNNQICFNVALSKPDCWNKSNKTYIHTICAVRSGVHELGEPVIVMRRNVYLEEDICFPSTYKSILVCICRSKQRQILSTLCIAHGPLIRGR